MHSIHNKKKVPITHYYFLDLEAFDAIDECDPEIFESKLENINKTLQSLKQSPLSKHKVLCAKRYPSQKVSLAVEALKESFNAVWSEECIALHRSNEAELDYESAGKEMIAQLKEKFAESSNITEKVMILSVLPKSWSIRKIQGNLHGNLFVN